MKKFSVSFHPNSIKFEISILYTLILGGTLLIYSGVLYLILSRTLYTDLDNDLRFKAQVISQNVRSYLDIRGNDPDALRFALEKTIANEGKLQRRWWFTGFERRWYKRLDEVDLAGDYLNFVDGDGRSIMTSKNLSGALLTVLEKSVPLPRDDQPVFISIPFRQSRIRVITIPFAYKDQQRYFLQVGVSPNPITQLLQDWLTSMTISIPIILFLAFFVGRLLAGRILDPVQAMTRTAQQISREDLSCRVRAEGSYVELESLAAAFNDMISRLEGSIRHIEDFSSHAAHELKTPLAIITGEAELALRRERSPGEYRKALRVNLEEAGRMLRTIEDLLLMTRLDYQPAVLRREAVDFGEFFGEIAEQTRMLATRRKVTVILRIPERPVWIAADRLHLRRLFFNIIGNALNVSPLGGRLELTARVDGEELVAAVADQGPGIAPEFLPRIFERFFRVDHHQPGTGLGLNIAQTIARMHGGEIRVESHPGQGSVFFVHLPLSPAGDPASDEGNIILS